MVPVFLFVSVCLLPLTIPTCRGSHWFSGSISDHLLPWLSACPRLRCGIINTGSPPVVSRFGENAAGLESIGVNDEATREPAGALSQLFERFASNTGDYRHLMVGIWSAVRSRPLLVLTSWATSLFWSADAALYVGYRWFSSCRHYYRSFRIPCMPFTCLCSNPIQPF